MSNSVKLVECPRDAWQGLQGQIPSYIKTDYLKALISAGFKHIDAVSFVSPKAVPQMADSEEVLKDLDPPDDVEIIGIVVNEKGAQRAIASGAVRTLGFPYSVSPTFLQNNQRQMLEAEGVRTISLADTVGLAGPAQIRELFDAVNSKYDYLEIGLHLHSRPEQAEDKILAAYDTGCRRFDSALGGLGGCPFAQDALVGNIATEKVVEALKRRGAELPALKPLDVLLRVTTEIGARYTASAAAD